MFILSNEAWAQMRQLILPVLIVLVVAYLLGSISFSIIITKIVKHDDIRKYGSGNAGATNVLRSVGRRAAALTFLFDFLKCVAAVLVGKFVISYACAQIGAPEGISHLGEFIAGFACILGHMFPIFFGFRGGKGVVTTSAMMLLVDWRVFILLFAVFLIVFSIKRIVSLASIIGTGLYPLATFLITYFFDYAGSPLPSHGNMGLAYLIAVTVVSAMTGLAVVVKHHSNIKRLVDGTEKPISFKKK